MSLQTQANRHQTNVICRNPCYMMDLFWMHNDLLISRLCGDLDPHGLPTRIDPQTQISFLEKVTALQFTAFTLTSLWLPNAKKMFHV